MSQLAAAPDFEWMTSSRNSSSLSKKRRSSSLRMDQEAEYEEEIQFHKRKSSSSPLMNFKLLDLTSFDDNNIDDLLATGSTSTDGATVDTAEAPLYETSPFGRGQDAWVQFQPPTTNNKWDSYKEDRREDPDCEYFDLTALSSEDVTMATTGTSSLSPSFGGGQQSSSSRGYNYTTTTSQGRDPAAEDQTPTRGGGRYTYDETDDQGEHPSDHFDLTVLSAEEEDAFGRVFSKVVTQARQASNVNSNRDALLRTPFEQDIVDLTAAFSTDAPIVDLTALTGDGPDEEQLTENGSVIVDLTHVDEDEYRDDWAAPLKGGEQDDDYPEEEPYPAIPNDAQSYESCNSQVSHSAYATPYNSGSFDWMTKSGATSVASSQGPGAASVSTPAPKYHVRWLDQQQVEEKKKGRKKKSRREPNGASKNALAREPEGVKKTVDSSGDEAASSNLDKDLKDKRARSEDASEPKEVENVNTLTSSKLLTDKLKKDAKKEVAKEEQQAVSSNSSAASSFLSMLWDPSGGVACQAPKKKQDPTKEVEQEINPVEPPGEEAIEEPAIECENIDSTTNPPDALDKDEILQEELQEQQIVDALGVAPSKESTTKRERIEKLRQQRKKRQEVLSSYLDSGRKNMREEEEEPSEEVQAQTDVQDHDENIEVAIMAVSTTKTTSKQSKHKNSDKEKRKSKSKKKHSSKTKDKKKRRSKKKDRKSKKQSGIVMTWKRVKASLRPWKKKRDVALFSPSSSEEDTDHESKARREEVRRSIERAAYETVRISRSASMVSDKLSTPEHTSSKSADSALKSSKSSFKQKKKPKSGKEFKEYDGDADTMSGDESQSNISAIEDDNGFVSSEFFDRTIQAGKREIERLDEMDMVVHKQTAAAAVAAIAIAAASRDKSSRVAFANDASTKSSLLEKEDSDDSGRETDDVVEEGPVNVYHTSGQDQANVSYSFYSTAAEDSDAEGSSDGGILKQNASTSFEAPEETGSYRSIDANPSTVSLASASTAQSNQTNHSTSIVPKQSVILADPNTGAVNCLTNGPSQDFMWLYGKDVNLPLSIRACLHCPTTVTTGGCCDVWQSSHASLEDENLSTTKRKGKSSTDSATYTTRESGSSVNSPTIACWVPSVECVDDSTLQAKCDSIHWEKQQNPFCNVPESVYDDQSFFSSPSCNVNPADTDTQCSPVSTPDSTVNMVYQACGIAPQKQKTSDDNAMVVAADSYGGLPSSSAKTLNACAADALLGQCVSSSHGGSRRRKSKRQGDSLLAKTKRRDRRAARRRSRHHEDEDHVEYILSYSFEPTAPTTPQKDNIVASDTEKAADYDGIAQATDDAFALLSQQSGIQEVQDQNKDEEAEFALESGVADCLPAGNVPERQEQKTKSAAFRRGSPTDDAQSIESQSLKSGVSATSESNPSSSEDRLTPVSMSDDRLTPVSVQSGPPSVTEASRNSSLFTPDESMEDISLGYSDSNMDGWSVDANIDEKKAKSPPREKKQSPRRDKKAKEAQTTTVAIPSPSQPISNFVMSIFGAPAPKEAGEYQDQALSETMNRPKSLASLASYESEDLDVASDASLSSLSVSLTGKKKPSSSLDRKRLEQLVTELMAHPHGFVFSSPVKSTDFPDYRRIVKHPMDLGTVLKRLISAGYPNLLDFHADVSLTFENAMLYNPEGTKVHNMAQELKEIFEENFLQLLDALEAELMAKEKKQDARVAI